MVTAVFAGEFKSGGFVQTWGSFSGNGDDEAASGFTIRRARLKIQGSENDFMTWTCQFGWDKQTASLVDAYLEFSLPAGLKLKAGQFVAPGAKGGVLTSTTKLDFIERAQFIQQWNGNSNLNGYRTTGLQLHGTFMDDKLYAAVMLGNYNGATLFTPSIKTYKNSYSGGMLGAARVQYQILEFLEAGGFFLAGDAAIDTLAKHSYGIHVHFNHHNILAKFEYLAGYCEDAASSFDYSGFAVTAGYKFGKLEPVYRLDTCIPKLDSFDSNNVETYINHTTKKAPAKNPPALFSKECACFSGIRFIPFK